MIEPLKDKTDRADNSEDKNEDAEVSDWKSAYFEFIDYPKYLVLDWKWWSRKDGAVNEPPLLCKEQPVWIALLLLDSDDGGTALDGFHLDVVVDFLREGIGIWQLLAVLHVTVENAAGNEAVLIV